MHVFFLLLATGFVESVDKLSTLFGDNFYLAMQVWIMWKTCPQRMWINWTSQLALWKVWISYPHCLGITFISSSGWWIMWKTCPQRMWINRITQFAL